jgi:hypothetical protein
MSLKHIYVIHGHGKSIKNKFFIENNNCNLFITSKFGSIATNRSFDLSLFDVNYNVLQKNILELINNKSKNEIDIEINDNKSHIEKFNIDNISNDMEITLYDSADFENEHFGIYECNETKKNFFMQNLLLKIFSMCKNNNNEYCNQYIEQMSSGTFIFNLSTLINVIDIFNTDKSNKYAIIVHACRCISCDDFEQCNLKDINCDELKKIKQTLKNKLFGIITNDFIDGYIITLFDKIYKKHNNTNDIIIFVKIINIIYMFVINILLYEKCNNEFINTLMSICDHIAYDEKYANCKKKSENMDDLNKIYTIFNNTKIFIMKRIINAIFYNYELKKDILKQINKINNDVKQSINDDYIIDLINKNSKFNTTYKFAKNICFKNIDIFNILSEYK